MDDHLQQWRCQQQQQSAEVAELDSAQRPLEQGTQHSSAEPSLFKREANLKNINNNMPAFPVAETLWDSYKVGAFSLSQWQEFEQQALIYKYMLAGAAVPVYLILSIKKSLLNSYQYQYNPYFHHHFHHRPAMLQSGYWGRTVEDAERGRCRRTDGKKWRCSRDVVSGKKYCERHIHRGRNRSRKPVETSTTVPSATSMAPLIKNMSPSTSTVIKPHGSSSLTKTESCFSFSGSSPSANLFQLNNRSPESKTGSGVVVQWHQEKSPGKDSAVTGKILRHFFDECPTSPANSDTHLSISIPVNPTSDFSLKLSTGSDVTYSDDDGGRNQPAAANWAVWENHNQERNIGGLLAEALRSSPTSVLHKPCASSS